MCCSDFWKKHTVPSGVSSGEAIDARQDGVSPFISEKPENLAWMECSTFSLSTGMHLAAGYHVGRILTLFSPSSMPFPCFQPGALTRLRQATRPITPAPSQDHMRQCRSAPLPPELERLTPFPTARRILLDRAVEVDIPTDHRVRETDTAPASHGALAALNRVARPFPPCASRNTTPRHRGCYSSAG